MGAAFCRNQGVRQAQTEWLLFLDDDDQLCEGFFDSMIQLLGSDPKVQAWIPDAQKARQRHLSPVELSDALVRNRVGGCSGFLIRKALFEAAGGFDEGFPSMQDWDLWLRLIERNALYYSGVVGVIYDPNSEQKITHNLLIKYRGLRRLYFKHLNLWSLSAREQHLLRLWALRRLLAGEIGAFGNWLASGFKLQALYYTHRWRRFAPSQTSSAKQTL
jgi:GT2 family glycosyltransferase